MSDLAPAFTASVFCRVSLPFPNSRKHRSEHTERSSVASSSLFTQPRLGEGTDTMKIMNKLVTVLIIGTLAACSKPFQPPPVEFKMWKKSGISELQVKAQMLKCGYPTIDGFHGRYVSKEEAAKPEQCMFAEGFKRKNGWKGVCSLPSFAEVSACIKVPD